MVTSAVHIQRLLARRGLHGEIIRLECTSCGSAVFDGLPAAGLKHMKGCPAADDSLYASTRGIQEKEKPLTKTKPVVRIPQPGDIAVVNGKGTIGRPGYYNVQRVQTDASGAITGYWLLDPGDWPSWPTTEVRQGSLFPASRVDRFIPTHETPAPF